MRHVFTLRACAVGSWPPAPSAAVEAGFSSDHSAPVSVVVAAVAGAFGSASFSTILTSYKQDNFSEELKSIDK